MNAQLSCPRPFPLCHRVTHARRHVRILETHCLPSTTRPVASGRSCRFLDRLAMLYDDRSAVDRIRSYIVNTGFRCPGLGPYHPGLGRVIIIVPPLSLLRASAATPDSPVHNAGTDVSSIRVPTARLGRSEPIDALSCRHSPDRVEEDRPGQGGLDGVAADVGEPIGISVSTHSILVVHMELVFLNLTILSIQGPSSTIRADNDSYPALYTSEVGIMDL